MRPGGCHEQESCAIVSACDQAMADAGVKVHGISGFKPVFLIRENQTEASFQHVEPFLAFVMIELLKIAARRQRNLKGLQIRQFRAA